MVEGSPHWALGRAAGNESIFELMETAGKLKENLKNPELKKDLVTINDKEAYQTSFIMNDKLLFELARTGGTDLSRFGLDANVSSEDSVEIPAELYIYKDSGLPRQDHGGLQGPQRQGHQQQDQRQAQGDHV